MVANIAEVKHASLTGTRRGLALLVAAAAAAALVACGSSGNSGSGGGGGNPAPATTVTGTAVATTETEYSITLSQSTFMPGTYTFMIKNTGTMAHNLNVKGPGISGTVSPTVQPGGTGQLTVNLQQGSYELWCSIDSHKAEGMDKTIQVG